MEALLAPPGEALRRSATACLAVNTGHVAGIALLVGGVLPLDLRLAGAFASVPVAGAYAMLRTTAAAGLALAALTGVALVSVDPGGYLADPAFRWKLALIALAMPNLIWLSRAPALARALTGEPPGAGLRTGAALSAGLWLGVPVAGRAVGFS